MEMLKHALWCTCSEHNDSPITALTMNSDVSGNPVIELVHRQNVPSNVLIGHRYCETMCYDIWDRVQGRGHKRMFSSSLGTTAKVTVRDLQSVDTKLSGGNT